MGLGVLEEQGGGGGGRLDKQVVGAGARGTGREVKGVVEVAKEGGVVVGGGFKGERI